MEEKTFSDEYLTGWADGKRETTMLFKKHLQEFKEELKKERKEHTHYDVVNKNKDFHTLHDDCYLCLFNRLIDKILNTQMQKHFGDKLI